VPHTVTLTVVGRVAEQGSQAPVAGSRISVPALNLQGAADSAGHFSLTGEATPGCYHLIASFVGYHFTQVAVRVQRSGTIDLGTVPLLGSALADAWLYPLSSCPGVPEPADVRLLPTQP